MKNFSFALLFVLAITSVGCYHAKVTTGRVPSTIVIEKTFASGWIYGLVPPSTIEAASECLDGVAIIETELSFVNQLVSFLTFGIYSPMHIKVTCATPGSTSAASPDHEVIISESASVDNMIKAFNIAVDEAVTSGDIVYVRFE